ncbi:MAG: benzoyl-CoA-dihydrodiol lyase, partial [Rhodospirillales bacterium]|nr:benzoyl-CoA-dihydrodiol lyase [Rhodospirillales bacterium]
TLFELVLAADRAYMLDFQGDEGEAPVVALSEMNFGPFLTAAGTTRLAARRAGDSEYAEAFRPLIGQALGPAEAHDHGLVTFIPDELDWDHEIRLAIEERTSLSPDALTGMEANLRFGGPETMATKIFGRLTAWQNWIFQRPNAVGERGALRVFGSGSKANFDWRRV